MAIKQSTLRTQHPQPLGGVGATLDGRRVAIEDASIETSHGRVALRQTDGPGVPLLFIHGNSSYKEIFDRQFRSSIGQGHRCIAIDLPGHGASSDALEPDRTYSVAGYADAAIEVLEALGIDEVILVGWSLGGHVALEMVASFPGVVGVMISGTPPVSAGFRGLLRGFRFNSNMPLLAAYHLSEEQILSLAQATVGEELAGEAADLMRRADGKARELIFRSFLYGDHADQRLTVATSDVPIAIVNGADDPFVNARYMRKLTFANLWDETVHQIPAGRHAPFVAAPAVYNLLLTRFVLDMEARAERLIASPRLVYSG